VKPETLKQKIFADSIKIESLRSQPFFGLKHQKIVMKKLFVVLGLVLFIFTASSFAQKQTDPQIQRDPVLEADAKHNLEVADQYFKLKKAYKATLLRCEEIIAANPDFSQMDKVLYYAGMSSFYLSSGKGKQKLLLITDEDKAKFEPNKLREDAIAYFNQLKDKFPGSSYLVETEKTLKLLETKK
jgi:outer membrane protein assembly factor BamD (BamD/ComL family)